MQQYSAKTATGNVDSDFITAVGDTVGVIAEEGEHAGAGDFDLRGGSAGFLFKSEGAGGGSEVLNGEVEVATELTEDVRTVEVDVNAGAGEGGDGVVDCALQLVHVQGQRPFKVQIRQAGQCHGAAIGADGKARGEARGFFDDQAESGVIQFDSEFPCSALIDSEECIDRGGSDLQRGGAAGDRAFDEEVAGHIDELVESAAEIAGPESLCIGCGGQCATGAADSERAIDSGSGGVDFREPRAGHCDAGDIGEVSGAAGGQGKGAVGHDDSSEVAPGDQDSNVIGGVADGAGVTDEGLQTAGGDQDLAAGSAAGGFNDEAAGQVCDTGGECGVVG